MLIIMDNEIETGMEIRKLNEDDNYYTKIKGVYYDKEEKKFTL